MGCPILVRCHLYIESGPWSFCIGPAYSHHILRFIWKSSEMTMKCLWLKWIMIWSCVSMVSSVQMIKLWLGNAVCITGCLWGKFCDHRRIPFTNGQMFALLTLLTCGWTNSFVVGNLILPALMCRHCNVIPLVHFLSGIWRLKKNT